MRKGFGIIELMIIIGVMALLTAGISRMISAYSSIQNMTNVSQTFETLRARINGILLSDQGWQATINYPNNSAVMACIIGPACVDAAIGGPFSIVDRDGTMFYDANSPTSGFTVDGLPCNTFNPAAGAGDDACPVSMAPNFPQFQAECPLGYAACGNPTIIIRVQWRYNAATADRNLALNPARYNLSLNKSMVTSNQSFVLAERYPNITGAGWTNCGVAGVGVTRIIDTELDDPSDQVTLLPPGNFRIDRPGSYRCRVTVPGFKVSNFEARLVNADTGINIAVSSAATFRPSSSIPPSGSPTDAEFGTQTNAVIETAVTINRPTRFRVQMVCASPGVQENVGTMPGVCPHANGGWYSLGLPVPAEPGSVPSTAVVCNGVNLIYSISYLSVVSCERMN